VADRFQRIRKTGRLTEVNSLARLLPPAGDVRGRSLTMQELMFLLFGLLCASVLIGSGLLGALKRAGKG
jgi:hypothetical protein